MNYSENDDVTQMVKFIGVNIILTDWRRFPRAGKVGSEQHYLSDLEPTLVQFTK